MKKAKLQRQARGALPLNWWERSSRFYEEILDNFNIASVIDLFGSTNAAIACVTAEPPKPYVGLCRNNEHVRVMSEAVDTFIVREMGREGPPASKFFIAEMKEVVDRLFPDADDHDEAMDEEVDGSDASSE